jgi:hypothetical protein
MHGFTNFEQSKALYEHGYRHPKPIDCHLDIIKDMPFDVDRYPSFSLADLVTMVGICPYMEDVTGDMMIKILLYPLTIATTSEQVQQSNQRLKEAYI